MLNCGRTFMQSDGQMRALCTAEMHPHVRQLQSVRCTWTSLASAERSHRQHTLVLQTCWQGEPAAAQLLLGRCSAGRTVPSALSMTELSPWWPSSACAVRSATA